MSQFQITLTGRQLAVYRDALEFYSRFMAGQIDYATLPHALRVRPPLDRRERIEDALLELKAKLFPELSAHATYGMGDDTPIGRCAAVSYEMYREVYVHNVRKAREEGHDVGLSCYNSPTLRVSGEPLPIVVELNQKP